MTKKKTVFKKDIFIIFIIISILAVIAFLHFKDTETSNFLGNITSFTGSLVIFLFGIMGAMEFAYDSGLHFLVLNSYITHKERILRKETRKYMKEFFDNESTFISQYADKRVEFFLNQIGLKKDQFDRIKLEIIKTKTMPLRNEDDAKMKVRSILKQDNVVLKQTNQNTTNLVYKKVMYFVNLLDVMYCEDFANELVDCLILFMQEKLKNNLTDIDKVVVSSKGNFLLGFNICKKLNRSMVKISDEPRILNNQPWEGVFNNKNGDKVIIIHDILVTGKQIVESIKKLPYNCEVIAIVCLINRTDYENDELSNYKIPIYSLIELSDKEIEDLLDEDF